MLFSHNTPLISTLHYSSRRNKCYVNYSVFINIIIIQFAIIQGYTTSRIKKSDTPTILTGAETGRRPARCTAPLTPPTPGRMQETSPPTSTPQSINHPYLHVENSTRRPSLCAPGAKKDARTSVLSSFCLRAPCRIMGPVGRALVVTSCHRFGLK
jgi:hypothetical protein